MFGADVCLDDYAAHRVNIRAYSVGRRNNVSFLYSEKFRNKTKEMSFFK